MSASIPELSIVIPAFNEGDRIVSTIQQVSRFLQKEKWTYEVLIVNDGSTDSTAAIVRQSSLSDSHIRLVQNDGNRGKGYSVGHGVQESRAECVLFTDADLSAPIEEAQKLVDPILSGLADVTLGSRGLDRALIGIHQPWMREQSGKVFNRLVRWLLGLKFTDTQCGFKAFRRSAVLPLFERQRIFRFGFDPEILFLAKIRGLRILEVPVRWDHAEGSKVRLFSDAREMFLDLIRIRWNYFRGRYRWEASHDSPGR
ncbi:MAG: glycosyltransferase family 2 protein [Acidobacteriia bacterium]|nr:glycosyltransferase family 2 protein [Terriglobia bacterium]